jgi:cell division initiation protein
MSISPVELHHLRFGRGFRGYSPAAVDRAIEAIAPSFEAVWRERAEFADRIEQLEAELERHQSLETLLRTTLVSAQKSAHELKDQARREAAIILGEAHAEARAVTRAAAAERERLVSETRKVRALLEAALDSVEGAEAEVQAA